MQIRRLLLRLGLPLLFVLAAAMPVLAQTKVYYWERFDVDITVQPNGDLRVVETQTIEFVSGVFSEGYAQLSTHNTEGISDVTVSEDGQAYELETNRANWDLLAPQTYFVDPASSDSLDVVWAMGRTSGQARTFEIAYTVHGAIRRYAEGNEFQWVAISPDLHDYQIRSATITLHMPEGAGVTAADYLIEPEFPGVPMEITTSADGRTVTWEAQAPVMSWEGIHIAVQFPPNTIGGSKPAWQDAFDRESAWLAVKPLVDLALIALGGLMLAGVPVGLYLLWHFLGRDPKPAVVPEYITSPPDNVPPGVAGTLVDESADKQDIIATLVDLARRGYLEFEEGEASKASGLAGLNVTLRQRTDNPGLSALNDFERSLYQAIFGKKEEVSLRSLNQKFYVHLPGLERKLYAEAVRLGLFPSSPKQVRDRYTTLGGILLVGALFGGPLLVLPLLENLFGSAGMPDTVFCLLIPIPLFGLGLTILGRGMPRKTPHGAEAAALSQAFKNYLANLEKYAKPAEVTEQFEKYLPYAIAFGLERSWINRFKQIPATPPPIWYQPYPRMRPAGIPTRTTTTAGSPPAAGTPGGAGVPDLQTVSDSLSGGLQSISDGLNNMLNSAGRALTSTPPSASTSSSRGYRSFSGGRSGGGFRSSGGSGGGGRGFR